MRPFTLLLLLAVLAPLGRAAGQATGPAPIRIAVISDQDDDIYGARSGRGGVDAARMAVRDFGGQVLGRPVVVEAYNTHNKPAEAGPLATQAIDAGADLLLDIQNSPIALAVAGVATERRRVAISTGSAVPALTRGSCSRYVYHYSFDAPAIEATAARSLAAQPDGKRWAAIVADAGFGRGALATMTAAIEREGGRVEKSFVLPPGATELGPVLAELRGLAPDVIAVLNAGADNDRWVAAVAGAGLQARLTTALLYLSDVERVRAGYASVQAAVPWYWNMDAEARAWADRYAGEHRGARPTEAQAADYSATLQWLEAVRAAASVDADRVVRSLDNHRFEDMFARNAQFRASDHMAVHDLYFVKVLEANDMREPQAWFEVLSTVPAALAFPAGEECKFER